MDIIVINKEDYILEENHFNKNSFLRTVYLYKNKNNPKDTFSITKFITKAEPIALENEFERIFKENELDTKLYTKQNKSKAEYLFIKVLLEVKKHKTIYFGNKGFNKYFQEKLGYSKFTLVYLLKILRDNKFIHLHTIKGKANHEYIYEVNHDYVDFYILKKIYKYQNLGIFIENEIRVIELSEKDFTALKNERLFKY